MEKLKILILSLIILIPFISAINLDVNSKPIKDFVITDLNEPAVFEFTIKNLGKTDNFNIYSLSEIDFSIKNFSINSNDTKKLIINILPRESIQNKENGHFTFDYKIRDSKNEIQEETLTINIVNLNQAISFIPENINPDSKEITINIKNNLDYEFNNINFKLDSVFFTYSETRNLKSKESKEITIPLEDLKGIEAGTYILSSKLEFKGKKSETESIIKFLEQEGIETINEKEGILIKRQEIIKRNIGNTAKFINIHLEKNIISFLFTTFNIAPEIDFNGLNVEYSWNKKISPGDEFKIIAKTNWLFPIIIILLIISLFILIKRTLKADLILRKKVSFVKTKGGEFALKVSLTAKAKRYIEKIHLIDKLPHLVKLYDRFGAISPDRIDLKNRRIEWNIESLNKGEERIFSYIIYSKIGVVGRFELPSAKAVYEKEGKLKEAESNRSFYINEPKE